jgi:hypothetical protein
MHHLVEPLLDLLRRKAARAVKHTPRPGRCRATRHAAEHTAGRRERSARTPGVAHYLGAACAHRPGVCRRVFCV